MEKVPVSDKTNPEDATRILYKNWREGFALPLLIGVLIFGALALIPAVNASESTLIDSIFITTYVMTGLVTVARFSYLVRMSVFLLGIYILGLSELITYGILGDSLFFFLALIIFSTILFSPKTGVITIFVNIFTFILFGWLMLSRQVIPLSLNAPPAKIDDWVSAGAALIMFGLVIILGFQRLEEEFITAQKQIDTTLNTLTEERTNLENRVLDRTRQLRKVNEIGQAVTSILDPDDLLPRAAQLIQSEFDCYYTAFFLLDRTGQWAELKEATGEAGRILRENKHRLDIKGKSIVSKAILAKQGQIASSDSASEQIRFDNPLLPYTRSQIALPLIIGNSVFGALEMHSSKENAFTQQDIDTYQNMANEIAIAIENSRLFQEAQQSLSEMRATQRQYLQDAWHSLTSEQDLEYAVGDRDMGTENEIEIPLSLREQAIGQIQLASTTEWTAEQKTLIEAIAAQAALALENARLVEESQSIAARERLANDIISKIWASANMDGILQTAARELGRTLDASEVEIEVSMDDKNE